jgi:hypothetical protein
MPAAPPLSLEARVAVLEQTLATLKTEHEAIKRDHTSLMEQLQQRRMIPSAAPQF